MIFLNMSDGLGSFLPMYKDHCYSIWNRLEEWLQEEDTYNKGM